MTRTVFQAFGLRLVTDIALPGMWRTPSVPASRTLEISLQSAVPLALPGATLEWAAAIDGDRFTLERGESGAFLFLHATGRYLLPADLRLLQCAPMDAADPAWFRVLLDSVLPSAALLGGREGLHAGSVVIEGSAVAIVAQAGGGKSTLLAELARRGHQLVSDDITFLETPEGAAPLALPGVPVMTLSRGTKPLAAGEILMELPGELWVSAEVTDAPIPLRAIVQLDRRPGSATAMRRSSDASRILLSALLALPKTPERALSRLDLASKLAAQCQIFKLTADLATSPARLAELVEEAVGAG